jgi:sulfide:quinone oxidoreductase
MQLVSPEASPLALFGPRASQAVGELLEHAGVTFRANSHARPDASGRLRLMPGDELLDAERIVALPTIEGPQVSGVPGDELGFIPVDDHGRVLDMADVYAAGDGTTFPVKQGGLACQQADAIAELLAAGAGAGIEPQPFRPVLRGRLLIGRGAQYLEQRLHGEAREGPPPQLRLWSAQRKVDGRYLSPWLETLDGVAPSMPESDEEHVDVEVALPSAHEMGLEAMRLDPYSPLGAL